MGEIEYACMSILTSLNYYIINHYTPFDMVIIIIVACQKFGFYQYQKDYCSWINNNNYNKNTKTQTYNKFWFSKIFLPDLDN